MGNLLTLKLKRKVLMIFRSKKSKKIISKVMYRFGVKPTKIAKIMRISRATAYRYVRK